MSQLLPKSYFVLKNQLICLLFLLCGVTGISQSLDGVIRDENRLSISGAQILNLANAAHTHSDDRGKFSFKRIAAGDTLQITYLGYETMILPVNRVDTSIVIQMERHPIALDRVVISPQIDALNLITDIDIQANPVNSSQDVLRAVPGLFIGQHAGGGKAEQIFLRGFDIDHGTDIAIAVDGMPVNMVSHAHGQGYADLHFVIPETIDKINFGKGPYDGDKGNFATAGYVDFNLKDQLQNSLIKIEAGQFNTNRVVGLFNVLENENHNAYLASEYISTDGPFESPQNFNRINLLGKYTGQISNRDRVSIHLSHFSSKWDASGQIPERSVDDGSITRFGAIDDTEGGETGRTNVHLQFDRFINDHSMIKNTAYYSFYDFELFSNFTFFLEDPINGDQIRQKESRDILGYKSELIHFFENGNLNGNYRGGISIRHDESDDNELSFTKNRKETIRQIQLGQINETNLSAFAAATINKGKWTFNPSLRYDYFDFQYNDDLAATYSTDDHTEGIFSPKLNILYNPTNALQLYVKGGKGFHSNDTRLITRGDVSDRIPAAYGVDVGFIWKPIPQMVINTALWHLYLEQEFVYVGDAGIVEPSGETSRQGIDLSVRFQPVDWLLINADANVTTARSTEAPDGEDFIPLAPDLTAVLGAHIKSNSGIYGGLDIRHLGDRPANENNTIIAEGYTVVDANVGYQWRRFDFGIHVQNLLDTEWNETQFATESRLQNEIEPVEEIHFTPGTPFFLKGVLSYKF